MRLLALALAAALLAGCCTKPARSSAAKREFARQQPCPANGRPALPCPGYVIDHITPIACGGPDAPANMQWQTRADAKAKDAWERRPCPLR